MRRLIPKFTVLHPLSDRDSAQGKADVNKGGHGYSSTTRTFYKAEPFIGILGSVREQWFQFLLEIPFLVGPFL
jgi:hypothetical protein